MKTHLAALTLTALIPSSILMGQTATDLNEGLTISHDSTYDEVTVSWWSKDSFYYFLMETSDLLNDPWAYFPYAAKGDDSAKGIIMSLTDDKMFFKVELTDDLTDPVFSQDFDADGLSNSFEFLSLSDLWEIDTDLDGTNDLLEDQLELDPLTQELTVDADGDGFPNSYELRWNTDASDPHDYPSLSGINDAQDGYLYIVDLSLPTDTTYEKNTIDAAVAAVADGDIVYIKAAEYEDDGVSITSKSFMMWAENGSALIRASGVSSNADGLTLNNGADSLVHGLRISGFRYGVNVDKASPKLSALILSKNQRGISTSDRDARPVFTNCLITQNNGARSGFYTQSGVPTFLNCTFYDNITNGTTVGHSDHVNNINNKHNGHTYAYNCIFWNQTGGANELSYTVNGENRSQLSLSSCIVADHDGDGDSDYHASFATNISEVNPFVLADGSLAGGSPAIAYAGQTNDAPYYDKIGNFRYYGIPDLGAFEYVGTETVSAITADISIMLDAGQSPATVTLDTAGTTVTASGLLQVFWDLDGDGSDDATGISITEGLPNLLGNRVTVRIINAQNIETVHVIDFRDTDGDGLPDYWEQEHWGHLFALGSDDSDLDGIDNLNEFMANTNPLDNASAALGFLVHNL